MLKLNYKGNNHMSQADEVLSYLKDGNSVTPIDALNKWGCMRLAAIIHNLKKDGWQIKTTMVKNKTSGKKYARYSLMSNANLNDSKEDTPERDYIRPKIYQV